MWAGDLEGRAVRALDEVRQLSTPLTDPRIGGRKLTAEGPGKVLNLADVYDGLARAARGDQEGGLKKIEDAIKAAKSGDGPLEEWAAQAVDRARRAQDAACAQMRAGAEKLWSKDGTAAAVAAPAATNGPKTPAELNAIHAAFWAAQAAR